MSFFDVWSSMDWDDVKMSIYGKQAKDVERALAKPKRDLQDFMALISPAAEPYLEQLAQESYRLTRQRFGSTVGMFIPLYLSNLCANDCSYCGFSMSNRLKRKTLDAAEVEQECIALKAMGFDTVLLVTGEHEGKVGLDYFKQMLPIIKRHFTYVMMEVQPLSEAEYAELRQYGLDSVMVYQETYQHLTYDQHHIRGKKKDFRWRLETPDRLGKAGVDKIGLGALFGLEDWRTDSYYVAAHLRYLQKQFWQTRYSVSFPRLRPCEGGLVPKSVMTDRQLVQLICAYRLFDGELELSLSTREEQSFRDNVIPLGITSISAGSKTQPGGYVVDDKPELEQFEIDDDRSPEQVAKALIAAGLQPVWTDWDSSYSASR